MAKLYRTPYPLPAATFLNTEEGWNTYWQATDDLLEKLQVESDSLPLGTIYDPTRAVGLLLSFPVADGNAYYRVVNDCPLTLQHVPIGDAYQISLDQIQDMSLRTVLNLQKVDKAFQNLLKELADV